MTSKEKLSILDKELEKLYPTTSCFLHYTKNYELLFAIMLSAQTTDIAVNKATERLFNAFPTLESFANASLEDIKKYIAPLGLANTKSINLINTAKKLNELNKIPTTREELIKLPGVGYKTATVYLAELYNFPSIPVDTHIKRIINRLKIFNKTIEDPTEISNLLDKNYPNKTFIDFHRRLILFGRNICTSRNPKCSICPLNSNCQYNKIKAL